MTRVVQKGSKEADCDGARKAIKAELGKMAKRGVWDTNDVYSLRDLYKTPKFSECMLGKVFQILGVKGAELQDGDPEKIWKARIVFQGSNVHTKSGTAAHELYKEISNAPASFAAARTALAVASMKGFAASLRDAESAYLQALIDTPARTPTFVELPEAWWPDEWYFDGPARKQPKYTRPHCRLVRALYGHPEAGRYGRRLSCKLWSRRAGPLCPDTAVCLFI